MATSPIYSWPEPDNTDLVKNGALAIRTMGNAIDTTMGTMTPKSTFTAKGSIAAATAASTPANLSVGADNTFLRANSSAATGLEYAGTYTTFTPTYANLTTGNGTNTGRYLRIGNFVHVTQKFVFGSTSSVTGNVTCNFPFTAVSTSGSLNMGGITFLDTGIKGYSGFASLSSTTNWQPLVSDASGVYLGNAAMNATTPHVWGSTDEFYINYVFEAA
jgi:hypothetical protein